MAAKKNEVVTSSKASELFNGVIEKKQMGAKKTEEHSESRYDYPDISVNAVQDKADCKDTSGNKSTAENHSSVADAAMKSNDIKVRFGTTLSPEVKGALEIQAKRTNTTSAAVIEKLVCEHLQSAIEEYWDHEKMKLKYSSEYSVAKR